MNRRTAIAQDPSSAADVVRGTMTPRILLALAASSLMSGAFAVLPLCEPAVAAPTQAKLRIGVIAAESSYREDAQTAYDELAAEIARLGRFIVVERQDLDKVIQEHRLNLAGLTSEEGKQLSGLEGVDTLLIYTFNNKNMTSALVESSKGNYYDYTATYSGTVKFVDTRKGIILDAFPVSGRGTSRHTQEAWTTARDTFIDSVILGVREAFALEGRIVSRQFRHVTINQGDEHGIRNGYVFAAYRHGNPVIDPDTGDVLGTEKEETGKIHIFQVERRFSRGYILEGFYRVGNRDNLKEVPASPISDFRIMPYLELVPVKSTSGQGYAPMTNFSLGFQGLLPATGVTSGLDLGLAVGNVTPAVSGGTLFGKLHAEYELIPEVLGLYGLVGLHLGGMFQTLKNPVTLGDGKSSDLVTATLLQPEAGLGARLRLFGPLSLFCEGKYRLPSTLNNWTTSSNSEGSKTSYSYTAKAGEIRDHELTFGGVSLVAGLGFVF